MKFNVTSTFAPGAITAKMEAAIKAGLSASSQKVVDTSVASMGQRGGGKPSAPGSPPNRQSGSLSKSLVYAVNGRTSRVGTNIRHGRIQELGGTINAKSGKSLAVPIHDKAKRLSSPRQANLTYIKRRGKAPLLVKLVGGKNKRMELWFVLLKRVKLPARPYLRPALAKVAPQMGTIFADAASKVFMAGVTT